MRPVDGVNRARAVPSTGIRSTADVILDGPRAAVPGVASSSCGSAQPTGLAQRLKVLEDRLVWTRRVVALD